MEILSYETRRNPRGNPYLWRGQSSPGRTILETFQMLGGGGGGPFPKFLCICSHCAAKPLLLVGTIFLKIMSLVGIIFLIIINAQQVHYFSKLWDMKSMHILQWEQQQIGSIETYLSKVACLQRLANCSPIHTYCHTWTFVQMFITSQSCHLVFSWW